MHPHPSVTHRTLTDAPPVEVHLAWRLPPTHRAVGELRDLVVAVVRASTGP